LTSHIKDFAHYQEMYDRSIANPTLFWKEMAEQNIHFFKPPQSIFEYENEQIKWFSGGLTNVSYNCLDRHLGFKTKNKKALIWEGENGDQRTFTYLELHAEVCKVANLLKSLGVQAGDRVAIYMPLIPESVIAMLACTRIGAAHTVIFGGFNSNSLQDRINDSKCKILFTADGGFRKGSIVPMKDIADSACQNTPSIEKIIVVERTKQKILMQPDRDIYWHEAIATQQPEHQAVPLESEHPLFILYTSGTTGKPKGLLHTTAGYLLGVHISMKYVFDLQEQDIHWCTADIGWITGHSYVVYGPLSNAATVFLYEGAPLHPAPDRFWEMIARHKITTLYTAPTAIRTFIKLGDEWPLKHDLSSLRILGSVGEPINPQAWNWYSETIGKNKLPVVDTWWQTETGSIMISPFAGITKTKPGSATLPFFGIEPVILNKEGNSVPKTESGYLCIKKPWPSIARTIYGDHERYLKTYWKEIPGVYFTGDGARCDEENDYWIMGRVDDVLNVSGHRLGTAEIESAIVKHPHVAESAVVGKPDPIKGQGIVAFVTLKQNTPQTDELKIHISKFVEKEIGAIARPDEIHFTDMLPKTRSGKIMRRLLRELANSGSIQGDTTTLEDASILEKLKESV
jgi:acetyl-CoA synthetase